MGARADIARPSERKFFVQSRAYRRRCDVLAALQPTQPDWLCVSPWTALANRVAGNCDLVRSEVLDEVCVNRFECVSTATSVYRISPGQTLQLVTTAADNLLQGNAHDPGPDAAALARETTPSTVVDASAAFWQTYWNA